MRIPKFREKLRFIAAVAEVIAKVIGFRERQDDEVVPFAVGGREAAWRHGVVGVGVRVEEAGR